MIAALLLALLPLGHAQDLTTTDVHVRLVDPMGRAVHDARTVFLYQFMVRDGDFVVDLIPGEYTIQLSAQGYRHEKHTLVVPAEGADVEYVLTPRAQFGSLIVNVVDEIGIPIEAEVTLGRETAPADGMIEFAVLAGTYELRATAPGREAARASATIATWEDAMTTLVLPARPVEQVGQAR